MVLSKDKTVFIVLTFSCGMSNRKKAFEKPTRYWKTEDNHKKPDKSENGATRGHEPL